MTRRGLRPRVRLLARVRRVRGDEGFTIIESVAAMVVAALIFSALAAITVQALRTTLLSRQEQQSADLMTRYVEQSRQLDYASLGMDSTDASGDSAIVNGKFQIAGGCNESVVYLNGAGINPHIVNGGPVIDGTTFTVKRYVTTPLFGAGCTADASGSYRRLTVQVAWTKNGITRTKTTTTLVTLTRRGLPQPKFLFSVQANATVNQGAVLTVPLTLTNQGARDRWNITESVTDANGATRAWAFALYNDNGAGSETCDGVREADENTRMDPNGDGIADTGLVGTDEKACLVAQVSIPGTESTSANPVTITWTATSNAVSTVSNTQTTSVTVVAQACTGCTYKPYYLRNPASVSGTNASANMAMATSAPSNTSLLPYSLDVDSNPGRYMYSGGPTTSTNPQYVANWVYTFGTSTTTSLAAGTADVSLYAVMADANPNAGGAITVQMLYDTGNGTWNNWGGATTLSVPVWGYPTYAGAVVKVSVPALTLSKGARVQVRVIVDPTSSEAMRFAYDTTTYNASLSLPVISGGV